MSAPSFADVPAEEAVKRASDLVPALRERVERVEKARILLPETLEDLHRTGVLRVLQPKRWGGMELPFVSCFDVAYELGRGCASTAWTGVNLIIHHWFLALFDDRAQEEVWGDNPEALIASGVSPAQGRGEAVDGGFVVSGRWNFSSGVNVSDWNMLAATVRDGDKVVDHRICLLHKSQYEIVDDWQVLGMRATGSMTVVAKDVFVPTHRTLSMRDMRGSASFPGAAGNPGPLFRAPLAMLSGHVISSALVGNAKGALELTAESIKQRSASYSGVRLRDLQSIQVRVGSSGAKIDAARHLIRAEMIEGQEYANRHEVPDQETNLRCKRNVSLGITLCTEAVDSLHTLAGANGMYDAYPIQRIFRDAHTGAGHIFFANDLNFSAWGLVAMGGELPKTLL
jgi:3-hydroxy-9,10-secoandrosta-1,3,5(10)-triene-9,17-dione monooxygenase